MVALRRLSWLFKILLWCHRDMVASMESKQTNYILHISYTNSEIILVLPLMTPTSSLRHSILYFCDFHFGPCCSKFVDIPYVNDFDAINYGFTYFERCRFQNLSISTPCLADSSCIVEAVRQHRRFSATIWEKKDVCKY